MKELSQFLEKFVKIRDNSLFSQQKIAEVLRNHIKKEIKPDQIKIVKNILYIKGDVFLKQIIFFKKEKIIQDINMFSEKKIKDIK